MLPGPAKIYSDDKVANQDWTVANTGGTGGIGFQSALGIAKTGATLSAKWSRGQEARRMLRVLYRGDAQKCNFIFGYGYHVLIGLFFRT
jgi:hypothetical protein